MHVALDKVNAPTPVDRDDYVGRFQAQKVLFSPRDKIPLRDTTGMDTVFVSYQRLLHPGHSISPLFPVRGRP